MTKDTITFHADHLETPKPAINVKYYGSLPDVEGATDAQRQTAYDLTVDDFWDAAWELAQEHGYSGVFSEGRSGGWLVSFYQYGPDGKLRKDADYPGQGPSLGYLTYPDVQQASERKLFVKFRASVERLLLFHATALYADNLRFLVEQERAERAQEQGEQYGAPAE